MNYITLYRARYDIRTRYKNGAQYTITRTGGGYILGGVTFATIAAALEAHRQAQAAAQAGAAGRQARHA